MFKSKKSRMALIAWAITTLFFGAFVIIAGWKAALEIAAMMAVVVVGGIVLGAAVCWAESGK